MFPFAHGAAARRKRVRMHVLFCRWGGRVRRVGVWGRLGGCWGVMGEVGVKRGGWAVTQVGTCREQGRWKTDWLVRI